MKKCKACSESFEDHFRFCPIDGSVLAETHKHADYDYRPTLISDRPLALRLITELRFLIERLRCAWPRFQRHPVAFTRSQINRLRIELGAALARPHVASGLLTALALMCAVVGSVLIFERRHSAPLTIDEAGDFARTITIDMNDTKQNESGSGIGAGEKGRVGFERGRGEGSRSVTARAQGGGGGGDHAPLLQSQGRLPQPSTIPAPIPTTFARIPSQALPAAGIDIDPVLWKDLPFPNYGDPRSKSVTPSNGPGDGGGVGTNKGTGIGEGDGPGFGPGRNGNIGGGDRSIGGGGKSGGKDNNPNTDIERVFRQPEV